MTDDYQGPNEIPAGDYRWISKVVGGDAVFLHLYNKDGDTGVSVEYSGSMGSIALDGDFDAEICFVDGTVTEIHGNQASYDHLRTFIPAMRFLPEAYRKMFAGFYEGDRGRAGDFKMLQHEYEFKRGLLGEDDLQTRAALGNKLFLTFFGKPMSEMRRKSDEFDVDDDEPEDLTSRF